jgi:hypothetical protein
MVAAPLGPFTENLPRLQFPILEPQTAKGGAMRQDYPTLGKEQPRRDAICTKCERPKRPTRAYMALLKSRDLPYICQACRAAMPAPPLRLGKLGTI